MAHAEKCPICEGNGKLLAKDWPQICRPDGSPTITCHGCGGKGWVEIAFGISDFEDVAENLQLNA